MFDTKWPMDQSITDPRHVLLLKSEGLLVRKVRHVHVVTADRETDHPGCRGGQSSGRDSQLLVHVVDVSECGNAASYEWTRWPRKK